MLKKRHEFNIIQKFENILGLKSVTDGTIVFYHGDKAKGKPNKPDGYYLLDGVVFILDAKAENKKFSGQLESYLQLDPHENKVGFKYNYVFKDVCIIYYIAYIDYIFNYFIICIYFFIHIISWNKFYYLIKSENQF